MTKIKWLFLEYCVVLQDRKWLPRPGYSDSDHAECEGVFCFNSVSITFVQITGAHAYTGPGFFGRPLQVVRPMLLDRCPVCLKRWCIVY